jgi:hypothetical protein
MHLLRSVFSVVLLLLPFAVAATPVDDVKQSFQTYKTAIIDADGEAAAEVVTEASHDYFRKLADQALTLDWAGLHAIHLGDRVYSMLLRHTLERSQLESMSGEELVSYAVDEGWIGRENATQLQLGNYEVEGETASGTIMRPDGGATSFKMQFVKEDGRWLLDLVALMNLTRAAFDFTIQQSGLSEDDFVIRMLEAGTGRKPGPEIWSPPL